MKKIGWLLFFYSNICGAQTTIAGKLPSTPNTSFSIRADQSALTGYAGILIGQGKTDDKGQINAMIDCKTEQPVALLIGNTFFILWAKPNAGINIREEADGRYVFEGALAKENTLLYTTGLMQPFTVSQNIGTDHFEPEKEFRYLDSIEAKRRAALRAAEKDNTLSGKFITYCNAEIMGFSCFSKCQYPGPFKSANKITGNDIPKDYFGFWGKFVLADDSVASVSYQYALQAYIEYKVRQSMGGAPEGTEDSWKETFRIADSLLADHPLSLQKQKTDDILFLIKYFDFPHLAAGEIERYKKQFPSSVSIAALEKAWQKKQGLASAIPSFRLKDNKGAWVDVKEFRGKVVYIDFWGSWCKACLANMLHAGLLKDKFKDKDVVFLYLDFYDTNEKWLDAIEKHAIKGTHLKVEKSDEGYFDKVFNISGGFPRYALIDKSGKLVTVSAPPPQEAYDLIKKYLDAAPLTSK